MLGTRWFVVWGVALVACAPPLTEVGAGGSASAPSPIEGPRGDPPPPRRAAWMTPEDLWRISGERPLERTADDAIDLRVTRVWHRGASVIHVRATGDHATLRVFTVDRFAQPSGASDTRDEARALEPEEWRRLLGLLRVVDFGAPSPTPEQWMALVGEVDDVVELRQHARYDRPEMFFRLEGADELLRALFELAAPAAFRASTR